LKFWKWENFSEKGKISDVFGSKKNDFF
jgi:hypothetical protein